MNWVNESTAICTAPAGFGNVSVVIEVGTQKSRERVYFDYNGTTITSLFYFIFWYLFYYFIIAPRIDNLVNRTTPTTGGTINVIGAHYGNGSVTPIVHFNGNSIHVC